MAFDLGAMLRDVSELDTGREQIEYISLDLIDSDPNNFYQLTDIDKLAENISFCGLQQPIRVRQQENGRYMIVSGHRRRAALEMLVADGYEKFQKASCIVERDEVSPALQQLRLIYANASTRKLSSAELDEQAAQVEKLLYQLKEEGYDFPGRMRDHVAEAVGTSKTKLARLKVIRENLAPCWNKSYKAGKLVEDTAYRLAQMPKDWQKLIFDSYDGTSKTLHADGVQAYMNRLNCISKIKCSHNVCSEECSHTEVMRSKAVMDRWVDPCTKCCFECPSLRTCKDSCFLASAKKKQLQTQHREDRRLEAEAKESRERPITDRIKGIYERVGKARYAAGLTVEDLFKAQGKYYSVSDEEKQKRLERGDAKVNESTTLPFGHGFYASDAKALCDVADALNCSIDYLLGRTEYMSGFDAGANEQQSVSVEISPGAWYPASVEPPMGEHIIVVDDSGFADAGIYLGSGELNEQCTVLWKEVVWWSLDPLKSAPAEKVSNLDTSWHEGHPENPGKYVVIVQFDPSCEPTPEKLDWTGSRWDQFGMPFAFDEARIIGWMPMPEKTPWPESPANGPCITGMSPTGHCGAAAFCVNEHTCCLQCSEDCNGRCGWIEAEVSDNQTQFGGEFAAAMDIIRETGVASVSMLQRRLKIGYAAASDLMDQLEKAGVVGPFSGSKPREILMDLEVKGK